ncbi:MAG: aldolase, partial [Planctomycetota bacterium]
MIDKFRELLAGGPQLGLDIMYPAPGIIERIGPDWDWVWIDGQHGELDERDVLEAVRACNLIGRPAVVRVPGHDMGVIGKALDTAAEGIMVPLINDANQARAAVEAAK